MTFRIVCNKDNIPVQAAALPKGARVEIEAVAVVGITDS